MGTTFSKDLLQKAGFTSEDPLEVTATPGEIRLRRASGHILVDLSRAEANALISGKLDSKAAASALGKVRKLVGIEAEQHA